MCKKNIAKGRSINWLIRNISSHPHYITSRRYEGPCERNILKHNSTQNVVHESHWDQLEDHMVHAAHALATNNVCFVRYK